MNLAKTLSLCSIALMSCAALSAEVVDFAGLPGANGDAFSTYTEGAYTVTNTAGDWEVGKMFGNPIPDLFCGDCGPGTLQLTDGGGAFTFNSVDLGQATDNGFGYTLNGFLGGNLVFTESGTASPGHNNFGTYSSSVADSALDIDTLNISLDTTGNDGNVDNINVSASTAAPEPGTFALLAAGFGLVTLARKRRA